MRVSIGLRLFLAVLSVAIAVAVLALSLARWQLFADFSTYTTRIELEQLQDLAQTLQARYRAHGSWAFLPESPAQRQEWLRDTLMQLEQKHRDSVAPPAPPELPSPPAPAHAPEPPAPPEPAEPPELPAEPSPKPQQIRKQELSVEVRVTAPPAPPAPPPQPLLAPIIEAGTDVDIVMIESAVVAAPTATEMVGAIPAQLYERISVLDGNATLLFGPEVASHDRAQRVLWVDGKAIGSLVVLRAWRPIEAKASAFLLEQKRSLALTLALCVLLSAIAAALLALHFRRPILALVQGAQALQQAQFLIRLDATRSDELGELARTFNQLAAALHTMEQSRQQWIADTSHELRTPLAVLMAQLEAMQDGVRPNTPEQIALLLGQAHSLNRLVDELYALTQADAGSAHYERHNVDLNALLIELCQGFSARFADAGLQLTYAPAEQAMLVSGDEHRLRQIVRNLLENSLRYTSSGGVVQLALQQQNRQILLTMDDSAPGVPDAALTRLGERFYRVEASRSRAFGGAGLGLSLCRKMIEAHGGQMRFAHSELGGLRVIIELPTV